jgi:hypothetical protein
MYTENGILVDFEDINKLVASADVFAIGFGNFEERLLVDSRSDETEMPLIQVVAPAGSPERRVRWLQRRRPSLGKPEAFSFVAWPHSPKLLVDSGVWARILGQVGAQSDIKVQVQCEVALKELFELDRDAAVAAIKGDNFVTLYPTGPAD